mmetsp:Transcript_20669/g.51767  ORF Transcript_20669/g.51767 Transcript_20669/m.51767 type:complete len:140 (-) Transcript_20669:140-559(-)
MGGKHHILTLAQKLAMLPQAGLPQKIMTVAGHPKWHAPKFSKRRLADLKKEALAAGHEWPMAEYEKPERPPGKSFHETRIFFSKGHKDERLKPAREANIAKQMAEMPAKIAAWREAKKASKTKETSELQKILSSDKKEY